MSGHSFSIVRRRVCDLSGKALRSSLRHPASPAGTRISCPDCGKGVTLLAPAGPGESARIPRHYAAILGA